MPQLAYNVIKVHSPRTTKVTPSKFDLDLCFMIISVVCKFHKILLRLNKIRERKLIVRTYVEDEQEGVDSNGCRDV